MSVEKAESVEETVESAAEGTTEAPAEETEEAEVTEESVAEGTTEAPAEETEESATEGTTEAPAEAVEPENTDGTATEEKTETEASVAPETVTVKESAMAAVSQYDIEIPKVSNGSVVAMVNGEEVTSAEAGTTVSLVATPDEGYGLKTISAKEYEIFNFKKGVGSGEGENYKFEGVPNDIIGWRVQGNSTFKISSLDGENLPEVIITVVANRGNTKRNRDQLQVDHGTLDFSGLNEDLKNGTITVKDINNSSVTLSAPTTNAAGMWHFYNVDLNP